MIKITLKKILNFIEKILCVLKRPNNDVKFIFIIGLPRSGTTLAYQIISSMDEMRPLYNIENWYSQYPTLTSLLAIFQPKMNRETQFSSNYGRTRGYLGVSEGAQILNYYRKKREKINFDDLKKYFQKKFLQSSRFIVLKNVYFLNELKVDENRDDVFYVFIDRAHSDILRSMCEARSKLGIDNSDSWSYCPDLVEKAWLNYDYPQNVSEQINVSKTQLRTLKNSVTNARKIEINYDEFKENHLLLVMRITDALCA